MPARAPPDGEIRAAGPGHALSRPGGRDKRTAPRRRARRHPGEVSPKGRSPIPIPAAPHLRGGERRPCADSGQGPGML